MLVSKKWWDGLTKPEQEIIMKAAIATRDFERKDTRAEAAKALGELKAKGMQVNEVAPAELARMRDKAKPVVDKAITNFPDLYKDTQAELARLRAGK
jgi:TRAP-type C4-dicarboxylate transport system substrate-binding protein